MDSPIHPVLRYAPPKLRRIKHNQSKGKFSSEFYDQSLKFDQEQLKNEMQCLFQENAPLTSTSTSSDAFKSELAALDSAFTRLISQIVPNSPVQSVTANSNFEIIVDLLQYSPIFRQKLSSLILERFELVPLVLLYSLQLVGACHYEDIFLELSKADLSVVITQFCLEKSETIVWNSIFEFLFLNSSKPEYSVCPKIINGILDLISSDKADSLPLLNALLPHLSNSPVFISRLVQVLFHSTDPSITSTDTVFPVDWSHCEELKAEISKSLISSLFKAFPTISLMERALELITDYRCIDSSKFQYLVALFPQDALWETIYLQLKSFISSGSNPPASRLLFFSLAFNSRLYFITISRMIIECKLELKMLFEIILSILPKFPSYIATEHITKLKNATNSAQSPLFQAFSASVTQQLASLDDSSRPTRTEPQSTSHPNSCELSTNKWVNSFETSGKIPTNELTTMKMFAPAELTKTLEYLLKIAMPLEKSSHHVQLVLKLAQNKWIEQRKMVSWEQQRLLSMRHTSTPSTPKIREASSPIVNFHELEDMIRHWSRNTAISDTNSFGASLAAFLNTPSNNEPEMVSRIHVVLWGALKFAVCGDWVKKALEFDKFISCTYVAQSAHFYPILAEQICSEMNSENGNIGQIAIIVATIASHDRTEDSLFLSSLWASPYNMLRFSSKRSIHNLLTFSSELLRYIPTRFKSVAIKTNLVDVPQSQSSVLEPPNKRIAILDKHLAYFLGWVASGCEEKAVQSASFMQRFSGLKSQISQLKSHRLVKTGLVQLIDMPLSQLIPLEASFEQYEKSTFSNLLSLLQSRSQALSTVQQRINYLLDLSSHFQTLDFSKTPVLTRIVETVLLDTSRDVFQQTSPSSTPTVDIKRHMSSCGAENANPNAKSNLSISANSRVSITPSSTRLISSSPKISKLAIESGQSSNNGENWFLSMLSIVAPPARLSDDLGKNSAENLVSLEKLAFSLDSRWWIASNGDPFSIHESSFTRSCEWLESHCRHINPQKMANWLTCLVSGLAMGKENPNFPIANAIRLLSSSFPELMVSLCHHSDFIQKSASCGHQKFGKKLKALVQIWEMMKRLGLSFAKNLNQDSFHDQCEFIDSHPSLSSLYLLNAIENDGTTYDWSHIFSLLQHSHHPAIPKFVCNILQMVSNRHWKVEALMHEAILGLVWITESASLLSEHLKTCHITFQSDSTPLHRLLNMLKYLFSSDILGERFKIWSNQVRKSWLAAMMTCLESLSWNISWTLPPRPFSQYHQETPNLECLFVDFLKRLRESDIAVEELEMVLPCSILIPNLRIHIMGAN